MTEEERKARKRAANHRYYLTHREQKREWARRQPDYAEKATERTIIEVDRKEKRRNAVHVYERFELESAEDIAGRYAKRYSD
jgi:hypothetical protein